MLARALVSSESLPGEGSAPCSHGWCQDSVFVGPLAKGLSSLPRGPFPTWHLASPKPPHDRLWQPNHRSDLPPTSRWEEFTQGERTTQSWECRQVGNITGHLRSYLLFWTRVRMKPKGRQTKPRDAAGNFPGHHIGVPSSSCFSFKKKLFLAFKN